MIKFRCTRCSQKIGIDDAGAGLEIACPTCSERLIVPSETALEFQSPSSPVVAEARPVGKDEPQLLREQMLPHLARLLADRLVQELLVQRRRLLEQQHNATEELAAFEQRLASVQQQLLLRLQQAEQRVVELEAERMRLAAENARLRQERSELCSADRGFLVGA